MMDNAVMWWLLILILVLLIALAAGYCLLRRQITQQYQRQLLLSKQLELGQQQWLQAQSEIEELRAGVIGVGQRVLHFEQQLTQLVGHFSALSEKQQAMELVEPESKIYSRAMKMVQLGADLDEIIRECELPRAEAELLYNLHQQRK